MEWLQKLRRPLSDVYQVQQWLKYGFGAIAVLVCILVLTRKQSDDVRLSGTGSMPIHGTDPRTCQEKKNLCFIKCMRCSTQCTADILRRFSLLRDLNVALPVDQRIYLGWPYHFSPEDLRKHTPNRFNMWIEHSIYSGRTMRDVMEGGTEFVTIIRDPETHLPSVFNYFNVANLSGVPMDVENRFSEYVQKLDRYEAVYKSHEAAPKRYCIPDGFSITQNLLAKCLGMPLGFPPGSSDISGDKSAVQSYIDQVDREFSIVMIREYYAESVVLLKRLMCWTFYDILYKPTNGLEYKNKNRRLSPQDKSVLLRWNQIDYKLYAHFNQTFWQRIAKQGDDFTEEVWYFKDILSRVWSFCDSKKSGKLKRKLQFRSSKWSPGFSVDAEYCSMLSPPATNSLLDQLKEQADKRSRVFG